MKIGLAWEDPDSLFERVVGIVRTNVPHRLDMRMVLGIYEFGATHLYRASFFKMVPQDLTQFY